MDHDDADVDLDVDLDMEPALSRVTSAPPAHPDLQATVTDFSDYTEYFPSDLHRSLQLIEKLDGTYHDDAAHVHDLTTTYSLLPTLPARDKPDVVALRKQISLTLDHALRCRFSAYAEATRLAAAAQRHKDRIITIRKKLQAQPTPPSRDPTPPPAPIPSPASARRKLPTTEKTPRITLHMDGSRHAATARPAMSARERQRYRRASTGGWSMHGSDSEEYYSDQDGSDIAPDELVTRPGKLKKIKIPKRMKSGTPKPPRIRPPGVYGTNVHSSIAGISTSNALAKLTPPPDDAMVGSRHKPWHKLTEYEMALLRKTMKKNAIWTPSETMVRRELVKHGRGAENYLKAKARAEETGEEFLDEQPHDPTKISLDPGEIRFQPLSQKEEQLKNRGMKLNEAKKEKRLRQAEEQAGIIRTDMPTLGGKALTMAEAAKKIDSTLTSINKLTAMWNSPAPAATIKKSKSAKKRKRGESIDTTNGGGTPVPKMPKKLKITNSAANATPSVTNGTTVNAAEQASPAPSSQAQVVTKTTTTSVPLAPEGSSTPPASAKSTTHTRQVTPSASTSTSPTDTRKPHLPPTLGTAALTRPRRGSLAKASPLSPRSANASAKPSHSAAGSPLTAEAVPLRTSSRHASLASTPQPASRPRSRGAIAASAANVKAQSAEPPVKRELRELRRGSNVSLPSSSLTSAATSADTPVLPPGGGRSTRRAKKPAPGHVVEEEEGTGKGKVGVSKRKGGLKGGDKTSDSKMANAPKSEDLWAVAPDEPTYCFCDDVSYGTMIACSNDDVSSFSLSARASALPCFVAPMVLCEQLDSLLTWL